MGDGETVMPKVSPIQSSFSSGEFSPLLYGRVDSDRYKTALAVCENYVPTIQGGLTRRPGTKFVAEVKDSSKKTRLVRFEFSTTQAYILEFGDLYIRFYKDNGQIYDGLNPYEIVTPYTEAELFTLKFTQSADILYIVHPDHMPAKLTRTGHTNWTLTDVSFLDGPYLSADSRGITLTPSAATGTAITVQTGSARTITNAANNGSGLIRITSAAHDFDDGQQIFIAGITGTTEANGTWIISYVGVNTFDLVGSTFTNAYIAGGTARPGVFVPTDVGRAIRMREGNDWGYGFITVFNNASSVTFSVVNTLTNVNAKTTWRLGLWSETTGYPACTIFHEDRLMFAGSAAAPQRIDGSRTGDYENFAPSDTDSTITASHGLSFVLNSNDVNVIRWMTSDEKGLLAGSVGGEWVIRPSSQGEALSPTNINAKRATFYGSANIQPVQVGKATMFVQRAGKKIREFAYYYDTDGFRASDLTLLSEHITGDGLVELAYQKETQSIVWCVRDDGVLTGMTYEREFDAVKAGWHRHIVGGVSDAAGSDAIIESAAIIPAPDGTRDELWLSVKRYIDGGVKRYVEYVTKLFENEDEQANAFFVDSGLTYDVPKTITGATAANPVVITSAAHGFSNGDRIRISNVFGMNELNGNSYTVANVGVNTFELSGVNGAAYSAYVSGGQARKLVSTISGLDHLEGETVSILADGAVLPDAVVTSGSVSLSNPSAIVHVGLAYRSRGQLLRLEAGAADGTALGKTRRIHRVGFLLHRSLGFKIGADFDSLNTITFRTSSDPMTRAPALFSGILSETLDANYDFENQLCWQQDQPLPSMVLAIMPQMVLQDRG